MYALYLPRKVASGSCPLDKSKCDSLPTKKNPLFFVHITVASMRTLTVDTLARLLALSAWGATFGLPGCTQEMCHPVLGCPPCKETYPLPILCPMNSILRSTIQHM